MKGQVTIEMLVNIAIYSIVIAILSFSLLELGESYKERYKRLQSVSSASKLEQITNAIRVSGDLTVIYENADAKIENNTLMIDHGSGYLVGRVFDVDRYEKA